MSSISLQKGRINQKIKTRTKILNAAKNLMSESQKITLEEVAEKASVARATIYRYFPNIDLLFTEASLDIHFLSPQELYEKTAEMPLKQQILYIQNYYNTMAQQHELIFRRYLSATMSESIESDKKVRGARRVESMRLVLESVKTGMSKQEQVYLQNVSTVLMGIEAMIVTKDVCGLSDEESNKTLNWAIEKILLGIQKGKS